MKKNKDGLARKNEGKQRAGKRWTELRKMRHGGPMGVGLGRVRQGTGVERVVDVMAGGESSHRGSQDFVSMLSLALVQRQRQNRYRWR